jgi:hypothetical protein
VDASRARRREVGENHWDEEVEELFARKLIRTVCDYADEYVTVLTKEGVEFIDAALAELPPTPGDGE